MEGVDLAHWLSQSDSQTINSVVLGDIYLIFHYPSVYNSKLSLHFSHKPLSLKVIEYCEQNAVSFLGLLDVTSYHWSFHISLSIELHRVLNTKRA